MIASLVPSYAAMLHALASAGAVEARLLLHSLFFGENRALFIPWVFPSRLLTPSQVQMHEPALAGDGGRVASLKAATVAAYAFLAAYPDLPPLNLVIPCAFRCASRRLKRLSRSYNASFTPLSLPLLSVG